MNKIFIISGPSGVGKTTITKGIVRKLPLLKTTVTYTTRTKRIGKKEDKTIKHISQQEFRDKMANGDFVEWAMVHENLYGTDKKTLEQHLKNNHVIMNIDVQGALQIKQKLPKNTILIFLKTPLIKDLEKRVRKRGDVSEEVMKMRLQNAKNELTSTHLYNYVITNHEGKVAETIREIVKILEKEMKIST